MASRAALIEQIQELQNKLAWMPELCPFCGGDSVVMHPNDLATFGAQMGSRGLDTFYAHCDGCGAEGPQADSEWEALANWNNRTPAASQDS